MNDQWRRPQYGRARDWTDLQHATMVGCRAAADHLALGLVAAENQDVDEGEEAVALAEGRGGLHHPVTLMPTTRMPPRVQMK